MSLGTQAAGEVCPTSPAFIQSPLVNVDGPEAREHKAEGGVEANHSRDEAKAERRQGRVAQVEHAAQEGHGL